MRLEPCAMNRIRTLGKTYLHNSPSNSNEKYVMFGLMSILTLPGNLILRGFMHLGPLRTWFHTVCRKSPSSSKLLGNSKILIYLSNYTDTCFHCSYAKPLKSSSPICCGIWTEKDT